MGNIVFTNNATGTLAANISDVATSLTLGSGEGALFPNPTGSEYFYITVYDANGTKEVMKVTARATDTFTVVRAQDGTSAAAFTTANSTQVDLRVTAAVLENCAQLDGNNALVGNQTVTGDVTASGTVQGATGTITANATVGGTLGVTGVATFTAQPLYGSDKIDAFPSGTKMIFAQASAPTRWTAIDTYSDYALRLVSEASGYGGTVAQNGSNPFSTAFDNRTIAQANLPNVTLTFSATTSSNGAHTHTVTSCNDGGTHPTGSGRSDPTSTQTRTTSSSGAHTHTVSGSTSSINGGVTQTTMNFDVAALDVIQASKD